MSNGVIGAGRRPAQATGLDDAVESLAVVVEAVLIELVEDGVLPRSRLERAVVRARKRVGETDRPIGVGRCVEQLVSDIRTLLDLRCQRPIASAPPVSTAFGDTRPG